jgi:hypothetical protein
MTTPLQLVLMVAPLAGYLYLLAVWHSGRHPRVVSGSVDAGLLALALGGLVVVGPFGRLLAGMLAGWPRPVQALGLIVVAALLVRWLAHDARRRLVVYHVDPDVLDAPLREALGPDLKPTSYGYASAEPAWAIHVKSSSRWQTVVIEAFGSGRDAESLIASLAPRLRERLRTLPARASGVSLVLFGLSALTMFIPVAGYLLASPRTRAALRGLLQHLQGG